MKKIYLAAALVLMMSACKKDQPVAELQPTKLASGLNTNTASSALMASTINFSGITWEVKEVTDLQYGGPGPNYWAASSVWVDAAGHLHLKIKKDPVTGRWNCDEVHSLQTFGYGSYIWKVEGAVDDLDKNIVLGLFNYKAGDNGHHEVDIEFARWGNDAWPNFNYTVYPAYGDPQTRQFQTYELSLNGTYSTYRFHRNSQKVSYKAFHGHTTAETNAFYPWATPDTGFPVSTESLPVHMNLWLYNGYAPSNNQEVEIIIHSFQFIAD